jgi:aqualysin 1
MKLPYAPVLLSLPLLFSALPVIADSDEPQAMIVVFQAATPFHQFKDQARVDARATAEPAAWAYLERGVMGAVQRLEGQHRFKARHVFSHALKGFAGKLTKAQIAMLKAEPTVAYIEADGPVYKSAQTLPAGIDRVQADISSTLAGNGSGSINNVNIYVIDTGIGVHKDLNLVGHINFAGGPDTDCDGHGTHVAGTAAARDNRTTVVGVPPARN